MWLAWVVLVLHLAAFLAPLLGVRGIYKRASSEFREARRLTTAAAEILAWFVREGKLSSQQDEDPDEANARKKQLDADYKQRILDAGLTNKTFGQVSVEMLTNGRSNLVAFASAVRIAKIDALWVALGLVLGLTANLIPTIWTVDSLVG